MAGFNYRVYPRASPPPRYSLFFFVATRCTVGRKCTNPAEYAVVWDYVTGRRGRVSSAARAACKMHMIEFARRHGLEVQA